MKRALIALGTCLMCVSCLAQSITIDGITYKVKDGEAYVYDSDMKIEKAYIKSEVIIDNKRYPVTAISRTAGKTRCLPFVDRTHLRYVNIPNSVKFIGFGAFCRCTNLTELIVPDNPVEILSYYKKGEITTSGKVFSYVSAFTECTSISNIRCQNGSIPSYIISHLPKQCPFALAYQSRLQSGAKEQFVQVASTEATPQNDRNVQTTPQLDTAMPQPIQSISDVDELPTVSAKNNENTFAIIFANEHYRREAPVEFAQNDGLMFKKYCESLLGLPSRNEHYVEDATFNDFQAELDWVSKVGKAYGKDANIIVYYAGHGIPDEKGNQAYLLPTDGMGNNVNTGYSLNRLYSVLSELEAQKVMVFLDACFSGSKRGEGMLASARGVAVKTKSESPKGNLVVFSAATSDETAYPFEENGHGLFTYFLLKKLKESAGSCSLGELSDYLKTQVPRHSIVVNSKSQTPSITASPALGNSWKTMKLK